MVWNKYLFLFVVVNQYVCIYILYTYRKFFRNELCPRCVEICLYSSVIKFVVHRFTDNCTIFQKFYFIFLNVTVFFKYNIWLYVSSKDKKNTNYVLTKWHLNHYKQFYFIKNYVYCKQTFIAVLLYILEKS